jgi:hypothetical protein
MCCGRISRIDFSLVLPKFFDPAILVINIRGTLPSGTQAHKWCQMIRPFRYEKPQERPRGNFPVSKMIVIL